VKVDLSPLVRTVRARQRTTDSCGGRLRRHCGSVADHWHRRELHRPERHRGADTAGAGPLPSGGGRKALIMNDRTLLNDLNRLVDPKACAMCSRKNDGGLKSWVLGLPPSPRRSGTRPDFGPLFVYENAHAPTTQTRRPRTGSEPVVPVRLHLVRQQSVEDDGATAHVRRGRSPMASFILRLAPDGASARGLFAPALTKMDLA
jgi:hypothetical protein